MTTADEKRHLALRRALDRWAEIQKRTYRDLALAIGVDPSHISNILSGRRRCSVELAMAMSGVTGIPVEKFLEPAQRHLVRAFLADASKKAS